MWGPHVSELGWLVSPVIRANDGATSAPPEFRRRRPFRAAEITGVARVSRTGHRLAHWGHQEEALARPHREEAAAGRRVAGARPSRARGGARVWAERKRGLRCTAGRRSACVRLLRTH